MVFEFIGLINLLLIPLYSLSVPKKIDKISHIRKILYRMDKIKSSEITVLGNKKPA